MEGIPISMIERMRNIQLPYMVLAILFLGYSSLLKSWHPKQGLQLHNLFGFAGITTESRLGAAWATVLSYAVFEEGWGAAVLSPRHLSPEYCWILLHFCALWKAGSSPTLSGLASCSHVFWSHVIVHEVIVPHACTIHNGKICVARCKLSNEDILDLPATP